MISLTTNHSSESCLSADPQELFAWKMREKGLVPTTIEVFLGYYRQLLARKDGFLTEASIQSVPDTRIDSYDDLKGFEAHGRSVLGRTARIVLNGGLGTTMGLAGPKSLLTVKNGKSFMDILIQDAGRENVPICLMNSESTHKATCGNIAGMEEKPPPLMFIQNVFPKILRETLQPAFYPEDETLEWNPAGHGDVYHSLYTSGLLEKLLSHGIHYAFISNSDNLGADLDLSILGYFSKAGFSFMMEVTRRTPSDVKGGHLAMDENGDLLLREAAQCRPEDRAAFQDIDRYRFFNTNNIWVNLVHLKKKIERRGGIKLPMMLNSKHLNPRDFASPRVYQIETAMGAAISLFNGAAAVCVPRTRFIPVKTTSDLLVLKSDRYHLSDEEGLVPAPGIQTESLHVTLDPEYYQHLDQFEARFAHGIPGLSACESLRIDGNVFFEKNVTLRGAVTITSPGHDPRTIPEGTVIDTDIRL